MAIKGARTIGEYAIRRWMEKEGFVMACFQVEMTGPTEAVVRDDNGDSMRLVYDPVTRLVMENC